MGVASLVLGIVSLVISFIAGPFGFIGSVLGILGIVFGAIGRKDPNQRGTATAGLVLSIISLCLGILFTIACAACFAAGINSIS